MTLQFNAPIGRTATQRDADELHRFMTGRQYSTHTKTPTPTDNPGDAARRDLRRIAAQIGWTETRVTHALTTLSAQHRVTQNPLDGTWVTQ